MKILHLIDSLDYGGGARQLQILGPALANDDSVEVCCLGPETPWSASIRQGNLKVHALGWTRWFDFGALLKLRALMRESSFDVIHVWRMPALRALAVVARQLLPKVVMSAALPARRKLAWWDRRLLARVRCLAIADNGDREFCRQQGIAGPVLRVVPPAVETPRFDSAARKEADNRFRIVCIGRLERESGFRRAVWAFDMLRQAFDDIELQVVGAGAQLDALRTLAEGLQCAGQVQFLGAQMDADKLLREADVVWAPSEANTGRQVALEAMAHGRVVIASDVPCLRECIHDSVTGYLVPIPDVVALVRRTYQMVKDPDLRHEIGAAAREHVRHAFSLDKAIASWREVYRSVAA